jgi:hypothetical protein
MAADAAAQGGQAATTDMVPVTADVKLASELNQAQPVVYQPAMTGATKENEGCTYKAFLVPYERDWDDVRTTESGQAVDKAQPGVIAGHVALVYERDCPAGPLAGKAPILRAGIQHLNHILRGENAGKYALTGLAGLDDPKYAGMSQAKKERIRYVLTYDFGLSTKDYTESVEVPKWLPQVVGRLVKLAPGNPEVKAALTFDQVNFAKVAPNLAEAINTAGQ